MDVGIQTLFASAGWDGITDAQVYDGGHGAGAAGRGARFRRRVGRRAPLLRLLVLPRQHAVAGLHRRADRADRRRHGGDHPAVERAAAGGREGRPARSDRRRPAAARVRPRAVAARVLALPRHRDGRVARSLRRVVADGAAGARDRLHRGRRAALPATAHRRSAPHRSARSATARTRSPRRTTRSRPQPGCGRRW